MTAMVYIVDDDAEVRHSVAFMLGTADWPSRAFAGGRDFLDAALRLAPGCVLLDVRMPGLDGLDVLAALERERIKWPALMMTGHGEMAVAVQAMRMGAVDFIEKPFSEALLLAALERAAVLLKTRVAHADQEAKRAARIARLSRRERDVLEALLAGLSNKLIAQRFGISPRTVEMHRAGMMRKLDVSSLAEALQVGARAGVKPLV